MPNGLGLAGKRHERCLEAVFGILFATRHALADVYDQLYQRLLLAKKLG
jgi:uncharacterized protein YeaC (DUF1315 family)